MVEIAQLTIQLTVLLYVHNTGESHGYRSC
jgi:hypothetical protein